MSSYVISISREFGSGGRLIGKQLAARLGIPCYDRTLIQKTSEKSGLSPDFIARAEERARSRFHLSVVPIGIGAPAFTHQGIPVNHQAFFAQSEVIRELADEGPCVIVGRCADYALANYPHLVNVFIYADIKKRAARVAEYEGIPLKEAEERALKTDKKRASYYNFYSNKKWGAVESYHLSVDSGAINLDNTARLILDFAQMKDPV